MKPTRSAFLVGAPLNLDGTPRRDPEAERARADAIDAIGAALVNARRELIHAAKTADSIDLGGIYLHLGTAIAAIDDATTATQRAQS